MDDPKIIELVQKLPDLFNMRLPNSSGNVLEQIDNK